MPGRRSSHQQKTQDERKDYWSTTIRGVEPTVETARESDTSTDSSAISEPEPVGFLTPTYRPSWLRSRLQAEGIRLLIVPLLIIFLSWFAYQIYSLNREVGQISAEIGGLKKSNEAFTRELEKVEARVHGENEANADRIRNLDAKLERKLETIPSEVHQRK